MIIHNNSVSAISKYLTISLIQLDRTLLPSSPKITKTIKLVEIRIPQRRQLFELLSALEEGAKTLICFQIHKDEFEDFQGGRRFISSVFSGQIRAGAAHGQVALPDRPRCCSREEDSQQPKHSCAPSRKGPRCSSRVMMILSERLPASPGGNDPIS